MSQILGVGLRLFFPPKSEQTALGGENSSVCLLTTTEEKEQFKGPD